MLLVATVALLVGLALRRTVPGLAFLIQLEPVAIVDARHTALVRSPPPHVHGAANVALHP
jgi:hypothetical protein